MQLLLAFIAKKLSIHFNQPVQIELQQPVYGGDINKTFHLHTNIGSFFLKLNDGILKDMFEKEFTGLQLLYQTQTIKIPEPVMHGHFGSHIFLITEFIQRENSFKNFWQTFAHQLAALHKHSNNQFGLSTNNYIGSLHQQNTYCTAWSEFYATQRIMPLAKLAFNQKKIDQNELQLTEKLCKRLYNLLPEEKPSFIHGDLWSGNFMNNENGEPVIYDPAVYYGNREMDIAMSLLFGGFDKSFYHYYNDVFPLQSNWKERVQLHQLYPLLVHFILFGGYYYNSVINILKLYN